MCEPNDETRAAIAELDAGEGERYADFTSLFRFIDRQRDIRLALTKTNECHRRARAALEEELVYLRAERERDAS